MTSVKLCLFGSACLLAMSTASAALAQSAPPPGPAASNQVEEIVVTARKTGEELQKTPIAVTALTTQTMTQKQIQQVDDLQRTVPGLVIGGGGTGPTSIVYMAIRGEAQNSPNSVTDSAVGIYVDGVYIARALIGNLGFLDIQHLEVLRGPQGTLFGRNTTGGALSVTTNEPSNKYEGYVEAGYGNYNDARLEGVVNLPLINDQLAARVALQYNSHDAYYTDPFPGGTNPDQLKHDYTGRVSLRWTPTAIPLKAVLSVDFTDQQDTGVPTALIAWNPAAAGGLFAFAPSLDPYLVGNLGYNHSGSAPNTADPRVNTSFDSNKSFGVALNLDYDIGRLHLKSITGYRGSTTGDAIDLDGTPVGVGAFVSYYQQHQISQELQLSEKIGKFDLIGGVYYFHEGGTEYSADPTFYFIPQPFACQVINPGLCGLGNESTNYAYYTGSSTAIFGQFNYHITDTIRFTGGLRWTWDNRGLNRMGRNNVADEFGPTFATSTCGVGADTGNPVGAPCSATYNASFNYPAWTAGLDWQAKENLFLYIKTSKASMAGGFNTRAVPPTVSQAVAPESNMDVEIGAKAEWFDHRLRANVSLFNGWQKDVQRIVNTVFDGTLTQYETNAGDTTTRGGELEVTALPWQGMQIDFNGSYLDAAYVKGSFHEEQSTTNPITGLPQTVTVDRSGEPVPQAPRWTFSVGGTQTYHMPVGRLSLHLDYAWRDSVMYTWDTPATLAQGNSAATIAQWNMANKLGVIPAYGLLNARVALDLDGPNVELAIWGRNLADTHYFGQQFDSYTGLGTAVDYQGDPRTIGGTITYRW
jgi:iron complex outermembrane receptor protein